VLGFIGLMIAAIVVSLFARSFYKSFPVLRHHTRSSFTAAFLLLALALFVWAFVPFINKPDVTMYLVFAGDALLLLGTGYLITAQFKAPSLWMLVVAVAGVAIITLRAFVYKPTAFVQDGILHFNLEGEPRLILLAILAFLWVPLGTRITQLAVRSKGLPQFSGVIAAVFVLSLIAAALFISARQTPIIVSSFAVLAFTFLMLAIIPLLLTKISHLHVNKQKEHTHGK
jgi:hypothetical protein